MATFAQLINGQALNVIVGDDMEEALCKHFAPGYDGGYPGVKWEQVEDGTESGAKDIGGGKFENPAPVVVQPPPSTTKQQILDQIAALTILANKLP